MQTVVIGNERGFWYDGYELVEKFLDSPALFGSSADHRLDAKSFEPCKINFFDLVHLVDKIDAFFEARLNLELEELKEDLEVAKQNEFGKRIFEAFATTYNKAYVDEDSIQTKLAITEAKLEDAEHQLATLEQQKELMIRESKMDQVLANLSGKKREHMAMVLRNVETERLEESYKYFIGRVLKEDNKTVLESEQQNKTTLVTGVKLNEQLSPSKTNGNDLANLKRLAGIK